MDTVEYLAAAPVIGVGGLLIYAAASDARRYLIPNWVSVGIVALFLPFALISPVPADWQGGLVASAAALAVGLGLHSFRLVGGGDIKLIVACALWAGLTQVLPFLAITSLAGGALALGVLLGRGLIAKRNGAPAGDAGGESVPLMRQRIPYGLAIAAGGLLVLANRMAALGFTL